MSKASLERAAEICERHGAWLLVDNAYEYFVYEGRQHHCVSGAHIIHIFSFSKVNDPFTDVISIALSAL